MTRLIKIFKKLRHNRERQEQRINILWERGAKCARARVWEQSKEILESNIFMGVKSQESIKERIKRCVNYRDLIILQIKEWSWNKWVWGWLKHEYAMMFVWGAVSVDRELECRSKGWSLKGFSAMILRLFHSTQDKSIIIMDHSVSAQLWLGCWGHHMYKGDSPCSLGGHTPMENAEK